mgnify:CR=1 FL=1
MNSQRILIRQIGLCSWSHFHFAVLTHSWRINFQLGTFASRAFDASFRSGFACVGHDWSIWLSKMIWFHYCSFSSVCVFCERPTIPSNYASAWCVPGFIDLRTRNLRIAAKNMVTRVVTMPSLYFKVKIFIILHVKYSSETIWNPK